MSPSKKSVRGAPRRPGGRPRLEAALLRSRRISVDVTDKEYQDIKLRADALNLSVRKFVLQITKGEIEETSELNQLSAFEFDTASILTSVAGNLARVAEAAASGIVTGVDPKLLDELHKAAHLLGMKIVGARAGVR